MNSPKTSLAGWLAGLVEIVRALLSAYDAGTFNGQNATDVVVGIAFIALGVWAKDNNGSGGSTISSKGFVGKSVIIITVLCSCFATSNAQLTGHLPKPPFSRHYATPKYGVTAIDVTEQKDSTFQGFRIGGPVVLLALPDLSVFTGAGLEYQHSTFTQASGRWYKDWGVGVSLMEGGQFTPGNLKAVTAAGLHVSLFDGFLTIGVLYNITNKNLQYATGPMTQLFSTN